MSLTVWDDPRDEGFVDGLEDVSSGRPEKPFSEGNMYFLAYRAGYWEGYHWKEILTPLQLFNKGMLFGHFQESRDEWEMGSDREKLFY